MSLVVLGLIGGIVGLVLGWLLAICLACSCMRCLLSTTVAGSLSLVTIHLLFTTPA